MYVWSITLLKDRHWMYVAWLGAQIKKKKGFAIYFFLLLYCFFGPSGVLCSRTFNFNLGTFFFQI